MTVMTLHTASFVTAANIERVTQVTGFEPSLSNDPNIVAASELAVNEYEAQREYADQLGLTDLPSAIAQDFYDVITGRTTWQNDVAINTVTYALVMLRHHVLAMQDLPEATMLNADPTYADTLRRLDDGALLWCITNLTEINEINVCALMQIYVEALTRCE